jgi:hypothetical protein
MFSPVDSTADMFAEEPYSPAAAPPGPAPSTRGRAEVQGLGQARGRRETDLGGRSRRLVNIGESFGPRGPPISEVDDELYFSGNFLFSPFKASTSGGRG